MLSQVSPFIAASIAEVISKCYLSPTRFLIPARQPQTLRNAKSLPNKGSRPVRLVITHRVYVTLVMFGHKTLMTFGYVQAKITCLGLGNDRQHLVRFTHQKKTWLSLGKGGTETPVFWVPPRTHSSSLHLDKCKDKEYLYIFLVSLLSSTQI